MTPAKERKAKERKAKRDAGLVPVEIWVPAAATAQLRQFAETLCRSPIEEHPAAQTLQQINEREGFIYGPDAQPYAAPQDDTTTA